MISRIEVSLENNLPTAVIFSPTKQNSDGWEPLSGFTCGGFRCETLDGWGFLLPLSEAGVLIASEIADEVFCADCKNPNMDYAGSRDEYREQQAAYRAYLAKHGLTVNEAHLQFLKQAAYPIDATAPNMDVLVIPGMAPAIPFVGLALLILGHNCD